MGVGARVLAWRDRGAIVPLAGHDVFVVEMGERGAPAVMVLHGFPGSTYDWHEVLPGLAARGHHVVAFDFLCHGLSAKPPGRYSLFEQADLAEAVAKHAGIDGCVLVGHDMGDTVLAELLMRSVEGRLGFTVDRALLTNGSIFIDLAQLSPGQLALLSMPDEPLTESLPLDAFRPGLEATFPADAQPAAEQIDAMLELIAHDGGDRVLPRVIRYIEERRANQERWTAGLVEFPGRLAAIWGSQDPIAVTAMPERLKQLRPETAVTIWPDSAHWPCIEQPARLTAAILEFAAR